jgi:protein TonB
MESQGEVWIVFIVDIEGKIIEPILARSVEFSIDEEAMRMMKISPDWTPAIQDGRKVKSWKKQPIIFKLTR